MSTVTKVMHVAQELNYQPLKLVMVWTSLISGDHNGYVEV